MATEETNFDPFEEETETNEEEVTTETDLEETTTDDETKGETEDDPEGETDDEESEDVESTDETDKDKEASGKEKMIPESRFKAALADVQKKLDDVLQENAKFKSTQVNVPDRNEDPEGYEKHVRFEMSKSFMMEFKEDYADKIKHYQEMAKINPQLNQMVVDHAFPAKFAYDLATRDLEIREITEARKSDEWKEFQEFKKTKKTSTQASTVATDLAAPVNKAAKLPKNLNRATASNPKTVSPSDDDYLFGDDPLAQ